VRNEGGGKPKKAKAMKGIRKKNTYENKNNEDQY
jgi:hypothetical protein